MRAFVILLCVQSLLCGCMKQVKVAYVPSQSQDAHIAEKQHPRVAVSGLGVLEQFADLSQCDHDHVFSREDELKQYLLSWKGVKYRRGGTSPRGIDCSGLTKLTYKKIYGLELPRTVVGQSKKGVRVDKGSLMPGDLVFFKTGLRSRHVGIYVGDNQFIHASLSKGVTSSSLQNGYWRRKFWQAKRYPQKIRREHKKILFKG